MKKVVENATKFCKDHDLEFTVAFYGAAMFAIGLMIGKLSVYAREDYYAGIGAMAALNLVKANGLEHTENMVMEVLKK